MAKAAKASPPNTEATELPNDLGAVLAEQKKLLGWLDATQKAHADATAKMQAAKAAVLAFNDEHALVLRAIRIAAEDKRRAAKAAEHAPAGEAT